MGGVGEILVLVLDEVVDMSVVRISRPRGEWEALWRLCHDFIRWMKQEIATLMSTVTVLLDLLTTEV